MHDDEISPDDARAMEFANSFTALPETIGDYTKVHEQPSKGVDSQFSSLYFSGRDGIAVFVDPLSPTLGKNPSRNTLTSFIEGYDQKAVFDIGTKDGEWTVTAGGLTFLCQSYRSNPMQAMCFATMPGHGAIAAIGFYPNAAADGVTTSTEGTTVTDTDGMMTFVKQHISRFADAVVAVAKNA